MPARTGGRGPTLEEAAAEMTLVEIVDRFRVPDRPVSHLARMPQFEMPRAAVQRAHELDHRRGRLCERTRVERRLRVVLDAELDALRVLVARRCAPPASAPCRCRPTRRPRSRSCPARRRGDRSGSRRTPSGDRATPSASSPPCPRAVPRPRATSNRCTPTWSTSSSRRWRGSIRATRSSRLERAGREATGHDEHVRARFDLGERVVGDQREEPVVGADLARRRRDELDVGLGQALQHLVGPDDVERGDAVEQETDDVHGELLVGVGYAGCERTEAISVLGRARADAAGERAAQRLGCAEAGRRRDLVDGERRGLEQAARDLDPDLLDVGGRRAPDLGPEHTGEVAGTHRDPGREPLDAVVARPDARRSSPAAPAADRAARVAHRAAR